MFCDMRTLKVHMQLSRMLQSFSDVDTSSTSKKLFECVTICITEP